MFVISKFHSKRPQHESSQKKILRWLLEAHQKSKVPCGAGFEERFSRVSCGDDRIAQRGHVMELYHGSEVNLSERNQVYGSVVDEVFGAYYPDGAEEIDDLIHVTCTGYVSPSGAQKVVAKRGWKTSIVHAYHMGCYGAFPALKIGRGLLSTGSGSVDVVHTELCSLHMNPSLHSIDQLVAQSLFADGFMKYRLEKGGDGLRIRALHEELIPDSVGAMRWDESDFNFEIFLGKEIPVLIARFLKKYLANLCEKGESRLHDLLDHAFFAVHPGGPKILDQIQRILGLKDWQLEHSRDVLKRCGNMSSATIPHIWENMLGDERVNMPIVSLAFGPGLTISGGLFEKCGKSC